MAKNKYRNFTEEELIHNQEFINTVNSINNEDEWNKFIGENKDAEHEILKARKIILLFQVRHGILQEDRKQKLWDKIIEFGQNQNASSGIISLGNSIKIAASVLIVLSLGSLLVLNSYRNRNHYNFSESDTFEIQENTVLTFANGDKVEVKDEDSKIAILENQNAVQINNDTIYKNHQIDEHTKQDLKLNELVVPFGKKTLLVLSDGTKVWLNAGSRFAFPPEFKSKKRTVFLDGEGYFEVAKNSNQPFIVSSQSINIEVLGTKFNVSAYSSDKFCETVLIEGGVNVWGGDGIIKNKTRMTPNQKATYFTDNREMILKSEPDAQNYIAWVDGWYNYSNESLEQVLIKLGRYYNVEFQYSEETIKNALPISGKLDLKESVEEVLSIVAKVAEIEYEIKENEIRITK